MSKSATKALRAGIGREEKRGISTILFRRSGSMGAFVADLDNWRRRGPRGEGVARLGEVHDVGTGAGTRAEDGRGPGGHPVRPRRPHPSTAADPAQAPQSARSPLNPRERTSSRRSRGLPDDLGGQVTISRVTRRPRGPGRRSPTAPHHRPPNNLRGAELNDPPSAPKPGAGRTGARGPGGEGGRGPSRVLGCVPLSPGAARSGSNPGPGPPPTSSPSASA